MQGTLRSEWVEEPSPHFIYIIELDEPIPMEGTLPSSFPDDENMVTDWGYLDIEDFCYDLVKIVKTGVWPN